MIRRYSLNYSIVIFVVGCIAAMMDWADSVSADRLLLNPAVPGIERIESNRLSGVLRLKKAGEAHSRRTNDVTEFLLVTKQACLTTFRNIGFPATPLLGKAGENGDWVFLAGVSSNKADGLGKEGPLLIETANGLGPADWYYTIEMLIIPRDNWSIRASLAFDSADIHGALVVPSQRLDPLHIGVAISFDYGSRSPMVLDLGYGRLPMERRVPSIVSASDKPDQAQSAEADSGNWVVSACLNIQF